MKKNNILILKLSVFSAVLLSGVLFFPAISYGADSM